MKSLSACARPLSLLLALVALLGACATTPPRPEPLDAPIRVLVLGDSISIGYMPHVQAALGESAVVLRPTRPNGKPRNCEGTTLGVRELEGWLAADGGEWDVIHFNFGLHDLKRVDATTGKGSNDPSDPRQAELPVYEVQLRSIVSTLRRTGARLVLATTTPVPPGGVRPHRDPADVERYNRVAIGIAEENGIPIDDLHAYALSRIDEIQEPVNVHFSKEGSAELGLQVAAAIERAAGWSSSTP